MISDESNSVSTQRAFDAQALRERFKKARGTLGQTRPNMLGLKATPNRTATGSMSTS